MFKKPFFISISLLALVCCAQAEFWTNQAGQVIEARLETCDGKSVTFIKKNGTKLKMPLSSLSQGDQRRVRLQQGLSIAPEFVKTAYNDARDVWTRFEKLPAHQQTEEIRKKTANMACAVFDARVSARMAEITDKGVIEEVQRLRSILAGTAEK